MANFWDLPRPIRDEIYRLHLVKDGPLDYIDHSRLVQQDLKTADAYPRKYLPAICLISSQLGRETAPVYYSENHFVFGRTERGRDSSIFAFTYRTWPRHLRLVRKVTYQWPEAYTGGSAGDCFHEIGRLKGLQELYIRVDEELMVRRMLRSRYTVQVSPPRQLTSRDGVALLRYPGMSSLLKIFGVRKVEFIKKFAYNGSEEGGPLAGGFLETEVAPRLKTSKVKARSQRYRTHFDFLGLPPELRNRIYALLLKFDGPLHPSTSPPSSLPKKPKPTITPGHGSALDILCVNRHIHDEAYGILYDANEFEFYYPVQLQAFILSLGPARLELVRDVTVHYHNVKSGGIDLAQLSLPMLKHLSGLKRLQIIFVARGLTKRLLIGWIHSLRYGVQNANPVALPGIKSLFDLRDVAEIAIRDIDLEKELETVKKDKRYPDSFRKESQEQALVDLDRVLSHVNGSLALAQKGRVNVEMLQDDTWHLRDEFPEPPEPEPEENAEDADKQEAVTGAGDQCAALRAGEQDLIAVDSKRDGDIRDWFRPIITHQADTGKGDLQDDSLMIEPHDAAVEVTNIRDRLRSATRRKTASAPNQADAAAADKPEYGVTAEDQMQDEIQVARPSAATPTSGGADDKVDDNQINVNSEAISADDEDEVSEEAHQMLAQQGMKHTLQSLPGRFNREANALASSATEEERSSSPVAEEQDTNADGDTDEDEDEIVVKHVARPKKVSAIALIGGLDGGGDERDEVGDDDGVDVDDSYANRAASVEL